MEVRKIKSNELYHHGIKGQRWGVRRYQNADGSLTNAGRKRYLKTFEKNYNAKQINKYNPDSNFAVDDPLMDKTFNTLIEKGYPESSFELAKKRVELNELAKEFKDTEDRWADQWASDMAKKYPDKNQSFEQNKKDYKDWYLYDDGGQVNGPPAYFLKSKGIDKNKLENDFIELETKAQNDIKDFVTDILGTDLSKVTVKEYGRKNTYATQELISQLIMAYNEKENDDYHILFY